MASRTGLAWTTDPVLTFRDGDAMVRVVLERDGTNWGAPVYRCVVDVDVAADGADAPAALEGTLSRIHADRAGMGVFDEVVREVMGVEPLASGPVAASVPDGAESTLLDSSAPSAP